MSTEELLEALDRYIKESGESDRQTVTKLGVNERTLIAWLVGRDRPQRGKLARLAGFFETRRLSIRCRWESSLCARLLNITLES